MRNLIYILFILLLIPSCSDTDSNLLPDTNNEEENNTNKIIPLKLEIKESEKNIFEDVEFSLLHDKSFMIFPLLEVYDSIVWKVASIDGSLKLLEDSERSRGSHFIHLWSHRFHNPGKHKTYVLGYKNDEVIYSDTVEIEITNNKDFLCYNWKDIQGSIGHSEGHIDLLNDYEFITYEDMYHGVPSVLVMICDKKKDNKPAFLNRSKKIFIDYINSLYSTSPTYTETDDNILEEYDYLFIHKIKNSYPVCIWITSKSRIALIKDEFHNEYQLYAEPN